MLWVIAYEYLDGHSMSADIVEGICCIYAAVIDDEKLTKSSGSVGSPAPLLHGGPSLGTGPMSHNDNRQCFDYPETN